MIYFDGAPLREIIEEVQYYTEKELILAADNVAGLIAGGSFDTENAPAFLRGLEAAFPIKVIERDHVIIFSYAGE